MHMGSHPKHHSFRSRARANNHYQYVLHCPRVSLTNLFSSFITDHCGPLTRAASQFGNMLVLAGTYNSELSCLVDGAELERLLDRSIRFLKLSEEISPTLKRDAKILEHIRVTLFRNPKASPNTASTLPPSSKPQYPHNRGRIFAT